MIAEAFLVCTLSLPSPWFTHPPIMAKSEEEKLVDFIRKNAPDAEVFFHPNPDEERLKRDHWERVPFTHNGNKIWIKRKPNVQKMIEASA